MIKYFICIAAGLGIFSCTKQDDYKKFIKDGEITYPGRIDSVIVRAGNQRLQLRMVLGTDPKVTKIKAYWNNYADSAEMAVVQDPRKDTVDMVINNLPEGRYNFNVFTYNSKNDKSVVKTGFGTVYGDNYQRTLSNRVIKTLAASVDGGKIIINWNEPLTGEKEIELHYKDSKGTDQLLKVPGGRMVTELPSYTSLSEVSFRSIYLPEENAFDVFTSGTFSKITLPVYERQLDKSKFQEYHLPTDAKSDYGWVMPNLWNESYNPNGFASTPGIPGWFTFDTGVSTRLSRFKTWQANDRLYEKESVKRFEIWGSDHPNPDGSWGSWTKLATCESIKPSGLPLGQVSEQDKEYALAGEEYAIPQGMPSVRYIRIKVLELWGNSNFMTMEEITFWTHDR